MPITGWICLPCWRGKKAQGEREEWLKEAAPAWAISACRAAGMGSREVRATLDGIPRAIKQGLPPMICKELIAGGKPRFGFGICGDSTGAGKTSALAALMRKWLEARETNRVQGGAPPRPPYPVGFLWRTWPATVGWIRQNGTSPDLPEELHRITEAEVLVLDDLGSERIRGSYVEDFAASQLDAVIDARYRWERPTFYTSNLDTAGLIEFYGARLISRLCGENPPVVVRGLMDLRIKP